MTSRDRDERGRLTDDEAYPDEDFLETIEALDLPTTGDVAGEVGCSRSTAHRRLNNLEQRGSVVSKPVGSATVWERA